MRFTFGIYTLDVDVEKTRAFYAGQHRFRGCGCGHCRNFEALGQRFPEDVAAFLRTLGIDPEKPAEVISLAPKDNAQMLYMVYYHLCGTILHGIESAEQDMSTGTVDIGFAHHKITETTGAYFKEKIYAAEKGLPSPAFQLEVDMVLPWVLDEPME